MLNLSHYIYYSLSMYIERELIINQLTVFYHNISFTIKIAIIFYSVHIWMVVH